MFRLPVTAALLLVLTIPRISAAQEVPDSVKHRNDCRLAAQVLSTGHPSPHLNWALEKAWRCPEAGAPLASRIEASAQSRDTSILNALTAPTIQLRDGRVFASAQRVAANKSASLEARIYAIRTMIYAMRPGGQIGFEGLSGPNGNCFGGGPSPHQSFTAGTPLPADYVEQVHALGQRLMADATEPRSIRHAGMCAALAQELILSQ